MAAAMIREPVIRVTDLRVEYQLGRFGQRGGPRSVTAVDGVSFDIERGQTLGLVGESGSGKTTVSRALLGLIAPTSGAIYYEGEPIHEIGGLDPRIRRGVQMVFQDPFSSLDPRMQVGRIIGEPLRVNGHPRDSREDRVLELLTMVGLAPDFSGRYPHQLSGGQRQRVGIARALALSPQVVVCDEPVSALDVSVQAQILNLLADLQESLSLTYLFVSHDLAVVDYLAHEVAVMHLGRVVEIGTREVVLSAPAHPYTLTLLNAVRALDKSRPAKRIVREYEEPDGDKRASGCPFRFRCPRFQRLGQPTECVTIEPVLRVAESGSQVACHFPEATVDATDAPISDN